jgi:NADH-quinone oxidoreductase subunit H
MSSPDVMAELIVGAIEAVVMILIGLHLAIFLLYFERKGSALIQDRVGANRASITGLGRKLGLPNLGIINTLIADPIKLFTKEDFVPEGADHFLHGLAPFVALFPVMIAFVVIPFGDTITFGGRTFGLQAAPINAAALYLLAVIGIGVYGVSLGGWASNNRWALLGGIRATAQMISYEIAMGLAFLAIVITYGSLDLQVMARMQGGVWFGWLPRWGIFVQPLAFIILLTAGIAESKRIPFDLPEGESELILGYMLEYSGGKQAAFMLTDLAEQALVAMLLVTFFFGGWQVPWLYRDGFHLPGGGIVALEPIIVSIAGILAFLIKVVILCLFMGLVRWTLPRFRYDQLMRLGWKILVPLGLVNILITAFVVVVTGGAH